MADFHKQMKDLKHVIEKTSSDDARSHAVQQMLLLVKAPKGIVLFTWHMHHKMPNADGDFLAQIWHSLLGNDQDIWRSYQQEFVNLLTAGDHLSALDHMRIPDPKYVELVNRACGQNTIRPVLDGVKKIHGIVVKLQTMLTLSLEVKNALLTFLAENLDPKTFFLYHALLTDDDITDDLDHQVLAVDAWASMSGPEEDWWRQRTAVASLVFQDGWEGAWPAYLAPGNCVNVTRRARESLEATYERQRQHEGVEDELEIKQEVKEEETGEEMDWMADIPEYVEETAAEMEDIPEAQEKTVAEAEVQEEPRWMAAVRVLRERHPEDRWL